MRNPLRRPKFRSPDVIHRAHEVTVVADPDEPLTLVIVQIETTDHQIVHVRMERGLCMTLLHRGSRELRVDIGLGRAGDYTRWDGAFGDQ